MCGQCFFLKCEGDLAAEEERKPQHTQRPRPVKHLRWQFAFSGGRKLPGHRERGRREGRAGLACRCSQRQGLFPLETEVGGGGNRKHIVNIYTHTLRLSLPAPWLRQPLNLFFTPRLPVCAYPLSHLKARTPRIPQAGVRKRSPGDQGPSGFWTMTGRDRPGKSNTQQSCF